MMGEIRHGLRNLVYPGLDLHLRNRASLCRFWLTGPRDVLDAGSGNGYFSWLAYRSGGRVVAISFEEAQVEKAKEFLLGYKKADPGRLQIERRNLYDLSSETRLFDEIICFEVLEHLARDRDVLKEFYRILRPGGVLHLCCPQPSACAAPRRGFGHSRVGWARAGRLFRGRLLDIAHSDRISDHRAGWNRYTGGLLR